MVVGQWASSCLRWRKDHRLDEFLTGRLILHILHEFTFGIFGMAFLLAWLVWEKPGTLTESEPTCESENASQELDEASQKLHRPESSRVNWELEA